MRIDIGERVIRRLAAVALLLLTVMALQGWRRTQKLATRAGERALPSFSALMLGVVVYTVVSLKLWRPLPFRLSTVARLASLVLGSVLYFCGLGLVLSGRIAMGEMHNVSSVLGVRLNPQHRLVTTGPFAIVRHPMYVGAALMAVGGILIYRTWTLVLIALHWPVFLLRAAREEQALATRFGEQWTAYAQQVPAWLPRLQRTPSKAAEPPHREH